MIFSSIQYFLFLPLVVLLYWRTKGSARLFLVVAASYIFYMSWLPVYGILLFSLTAVNWILGKAIAQSRGGSGPRLDKLFLGLGLLVNLGCLCYYKYANFFLAQIAHSLHIFQDLTGNALPSFDAPILSVILPLGISFFVFEFVHYIVDIYKGDAPISSFWEFTAFASFFPSQIAGPIKRYQDFMEHLRAPLAFSGELFNEGMTLIMQGLFKKVALADTLGAVIYTGFATHGPLTSADALICTIGFYIQVYCDFSGYTDLGRGSALLLGIRLPENFNLPYLSLDIADFWRRWHMSLSFWLRDYVYIPLGGSRGSRLATARNLFITMAACGLWHGAAWHYVLYGCSQGLAQIVNKEWRKILSKAHGFARLAESNLGRLASLLATVIFVATTFVIFRAPDMTHVLYVYQGYFNFAGESNLYVPLMKSGIFSFLALYLGYYLLSQYLKTHPAKFAFLRADFPGQNLLYAEPVRLASWTAVLILIFAARPVAAIPFVYFQF